MAAAIDRWSASGLVDASPVSLEGLRYGVADLTEMRLGETKGGEILFDVDGAGAGWFVDPTPADDAEFDAVRGANALAAPAGSPAHGVYDFLTVALHEIGHVLGLVDLGGELDVLMSSALVPGVRRLPSAWDPGSDVPQSSVSGLLNGASDEERFLDGLVIEFIEEYAISAADQFRRRPCCIHRR